MQNNTLKNTLLLFRLCLGLTVGDEEIARLDKDAIKAAYKLAKRHDLAHLVASAVKRRNLECDEETAAKLDKQHIMALFRCKHQMHELSLVSAALERAEIFHIPLKGSVLRSYYPSEWMRVGCDVDILVRPDDLERAIEVISSECSFTYVDKGPHDVTLKSPAGNPLELHYDLIEKEEHGEDKVLERFTDTATPKVGCRYCHEVSDEMFYYYHLAHMAKHFTHGGFGMRSILDIWVLNHRKSFDPAAREALLAEGRYLKLDLVARALADVWLEGGVHTDSTVALESFIVGAGVFGTSSSRAEINTVRHGSGFKYLLSRAFLPYSQLRFQYPSLDGKRWLTPIYQLRRIMRVLFGGELKRSVTEINSSVGISDERSVQMRHLLDDLGL